MNWLKKLFGGTTGSTGPGPGVVNVAPSLRGLRPVRDMTMPEAKRITTENVSDWCAKLEKEGERTGNQRLIAQARNIRSRLT